MHGELVDKGVTMSIETHHHTKGARMPRGGYRGGHRPKLPPEEKAVTMAIVVAPGLRDALKNLAAQRGVSVSSIVQGYIRRGMAADTEDAIREDIDWEAAEETVNPPTTPE